MAVRRGDECLRGGILGVLLYRNGHAKAAARQLDGDLAGSDVHALYLAGERAAVAAAAIDSAAREPAFRTDHPDAERVLVARDLAGGQRARDVVRHRVRDAVDVRL